MRILLSLVAAFVALGAFYGGGALVADPSGGWLGLPIAMLEPSPFETFLIPGLLLFVLVGGSQTIAGTLHATGRRVAPIASIVAAAILVGWITIQVLLIQSIVFAHVLFGGIGVVQALLAVRALGAETPHDTDALARAFFSHSRIAFVGLSDKAEAFSATVAKEMRERGLTVEGVNPRLAAQGVEGFVAHLADLDDPPSAALVMVNAKNALAATEDCIAAGVQTIWFHRGAGPGSDSPEALARAEAAGLQVVHGVCPLMYLEPVGWLHRAHRNLSAA